MHANSRFIVLFLSVAIAAGPAASQDAPESRPTSIDPRGIFGSLIICGGGRLDDAIIERFVELAGGEEGRLVVIPTASRSADEADASASAKRWREHGVGNVVLLHTRDRSVADSPEFTQPLVDATAVWFSGGSQSRIAEAYVGTRVETELRKLLARGGVVGGTSAGAAIQSRTMIASGNPVPVIKQGLGFIPNTIIDQHFVARKRLPRLQRALRDNPGLVGIGIDEGTAIEVRGRRIRVLGESTATVVLAASSDRDERLIQLKHGQQADLVALQRAAIARTEPSFPETPRHAPVVEHGALVIVGGGKVTEPIARHFIDLAGGKDSRIVVIPTASPDLQARRQKVPNFLDDADLADVRMLPHRWPEEILSAEFRNALEHATGVWFNGGRQWRFVDAYEGTVAIELFRTVLRRGGVIGGSSAGASIQAEYLVRGHPLGNRVMMAEGYERGFNFLPGTAIDQHFAQRDRFQDLEGVVRKHPQLLGIGIDESTAIVVQGGIARVVGTNHVHFYDASAVANDSDLAPVRLEDGQQYDLRKRAQP